MRILLGEIESVWKNYIRELAYENGQVQIVGEVQNHLEILMRVRDENADVVVLSQTPQGDEPGICSHLLLEYPNVLLVLVPTEGGPDILWRMRLRKEARQASRDVLLSMLQNRDDPVL
jgi:DNA-binding NarL/FixJ family response regulator